MKAQQGYQCLPVPPLGRVEVLPAPSCECWSSLPSWSNLRTQRLWVDKTGDNFASKRIFTLNTKIYFLLSTCTPVLLIAASDQGLWLFFQYFLKFASLSDKNNSYNLRHYCLLLATRLQLSNNVCINKLLFVTLYYWLTRCVCCSKPLLLGF